MTCLHECSRLYSFYSRLVQYPHEVRICTIMHTWGLFRRPEFVEKRDLPAINQLRTTDNVHSLLVYLRWCLLSNLFNIHTATRTGYHTGTLQRRPGIQVGLPYWNPAGVQGPYREDQGYKWDYHTGTLQGYRDPTEKTRDTSGTTILEPCRGTGTLQRRPGIQVGLPYWNPAGVQGHEGRATTCRIDNGGGATIQEGVDTGSTIQGPCRTDNGGGATTRGPWGKGGGATIWGCCRTDHR